MIHELNDSVKGVFTTEDIPISPNVMQAIDILDVLQVDLSCDFIIVIIGIGGGGRGVGWGELERICISVKG